ncbi:MAG: class I mannose-6-phosphate isomerase [Bacteroidota bacterium]
MHSGTVRKTTQHLAPARPPFVEPGSYNIYPGFPLAPGKIGLGFEAMADRILASGQRAVILDGFVGVIWDQLVERLGSELGRKGKKVRFIDIRSSLLPAGEITKLTKPFLGGDDPLFGRRSTLTLADFFDQNHLRQLRPDPESDLTVLFGSGAALVGWEGLLVYIDVPKNEVQFRSRAGSILNLGATWPESPQVMYKRFYFVDWPILNRHRKAYLNSIDLFVDGQRPDEPAVMDGDDVRDGLSAMAVNCFRPRPWFEPGPWGGQWIKERIPHVAEDVPNYAWSFELIYPENGIAFSSDGILFEMSADFLMLQHSRDVLGKFSERFGYEFPIRYDFLDTFAGGNLSVQCHPRPEYVHKHFGETFTQDECYYILDCKPNARVYLGLQEDADPMAFRSELEKSQTTGLPVDIDSFVNSEPVRKHDLFLIPNGTIHCSGIDNLVLEISATPYIFTFKMYDWLRMDLSGNPRTLNIARAFENLYFDRRAKLIRQDFISRPAVLGQGPDWKLVHLPTHPGHFYDVHRIEFLSVVDVVTNGSCHVLNVVEGTCVEIVTKRGVRMPFNYAETFVVPAAAESYQLINKGPGPAKVVKTFLKPDAQPYAVPEGAKEND